MWLISIRNADGQWMGVYVEPQKGQEQRQRRRVQLRVREGIAWAGFEVEREPNAHAHLGHGGL